VHTSTLYLIRQQVDLAEKIARLSGIRTPGSSLPTPGPRRTRRRCYWRRTTAAVNQVLAVRNSYHGRTFATMANHRQSQLVDVVDEPAERELPALR